MNKAIEFKNRILRDTFLPKLTNSSIRTEILASILETYEYRNRLNISQDKWSELKEISIATVKRIELGTCYDLLLINKYSN